MTTASGNKAGPKRPDVFISYSRKDRDFVKRLEAALQARGREAWVDWEGIRPAEEFMQAIFPAIEGTDTFVFVISPDSVTSEICGRELAHAASHNKRMVPIFAREVDVKAIPEALAKLNWVFFCRENEDFDVGTDTLISALDTDLGWVHAHTRLLTRAIEWEAKGKSNSFLLRGEDLRAAEEWLAQAGADKERQPTELQTEYIIASRKGASRRQRIVFGAVSLALVVSIVLTIVALTQRQQAIAQRNEAERATQVALSRQLAAQSELLRNQHPTSLPRSVLLAAEAMQRFPSIDAHVVLRAGVGLLPRWLAQMELDKDVRCVAMAIDGKYAVSGSEDGTARIWEVPSGKLLARLEHGSLVNAVLLANDGNYLATRGETKAGKPAVRLWSAPGGKLITQIPQADGAIAFSPDSKRFAVATTVGDSSGLLIYDPATGKKIFSISGGAPHALAFTADGKRLTNGERVWNAVTGQEVSRFQFQADENASVRAVAFSPDDKFVVTGTGGQFAFLWDAATGQRLKTFRQKRQKSYAALEDVFRHDFSMTVSFSPDGKYLATAGGDIQARVWEVEGQKEVATLPHQNMVRWAAFTGNGQQVLTAGDDGTVRLWEALSGHELTRITSDLEAEKYGEAGSTSSGKYIVVGAGRRVSLWESVTGRVGRRLVHKTAVTGVTFSRDGKLLATCDTTTARVWDVASGEPIAPPMIQEEENIGSSLRDELKSVDFSPDGKLLGTANGDQTARIWDVSSGKEIVRLPLKAMVDMASFSSDGKVFVTTNSGDGPEENIDLWDGPDWHLALHVEGKSALLSPDGKLLGIAQENKLQVLQVTNRKQILSIDRQGPFFIRAFSLDSKYIATSDDKGAVSITEITSGQRIATLKQESEVRAIAFSPDGKHVAITSGQLAKIWEWKSEKEVRRFSHEADVIALSYSPDGTTLATSAGNDARVWDVASGEELARVSHDQPVTRAVFSSDGKTLATAGDDGVVQLSLWSSQAWVDEGCARLNQNLTPREWQQYLGNQPYRKTCPALP
jgi:WD40 repeat protein